MLKLAQKTRTAVAKGFSPIGRMYHAEIPLEAISMALAAEGLLLLQEDNTAYCGMFCGREGNAKIAVGHTATATPSKWDKNVMSFVPLKNTMLIMTWYKIDTKYEIVVYLS